MVAAQLWGLPPSQAHDPARPETERGRGRAEPGDEQLRAGASERGGVVILRQPQALQPDALGMLGEGEGMAEGIARGFAGEDGG